MNKLIFNVSRLQTNYKTHVLRKILKKLAPQATTKENPNIVLNYAYKKTDIFKKEVPPREGAREP